MKKIAVVYWSGTGNTAAMADAVAEGIQGAGGEAEKITAADFNESVAGNLMHMHSGVLQWVLKFWRNLSLNQCGSR